jgi:uncharacterized protein YfiM (DUF2279 family)
MHFLLWSGFIKLMRGAFVLLLILITILSVIPNPEEVPGGMAFTRWIAQLLFGNPDYGDKVSHFLAYGALSGAGMLGFVRPFSRWLMLPIIVALYSAVMELLQAVIGVRSAEWADMAANVSGVMAGTLVAVGLIFLAKRASSAKTENL